MSFKGAYIKTLFDTMVLPYHNNDNIPVEEGKWYLVNTKFGEDIGLAMSGVKDISYDQIQYKSSHNNNHNDHNDTELEGIEIDDASILEKKEEHVPIEFDNLIILRTVSKNEYEEWNTYRDEEKKAFNIAKKEIADLKLEMKLINVHFLYQKKKVIFNFTADNRIDFRQLVKRLASIFRTRIEMRQIGVRDAAKIVNGYGICGIKTCCSRSNCHINSIYLKMAKEQGFVVNSSKLTGLCGRLMCCLAYEHDFYMDQKTKYPDIGAVIKDGGSRFVITSINMLTEEIFAVDNEHRQKKFSLKGIKKENRIGGDYFALNSNNN